MNGKLREKLGGKKLLIAFTQDAQHFMLKEDDGNNAFLFPRNGSKKMGEVKLLLENKKIPFPAKYEVWFRDDVQFWQGDLLENPTQSLPGKLRSSKKN